MESNIDNLISIIVPVYKVEKYLDRCVESIINQSYTNIEIILVDDGSPDKCPELCDEWVKKDARVHVIHKNNGGVSSARNAGIIKATGKYITFIDSDDKVNHIFSEFLKFAVEVDCDMVLSNSLGIQNFSQFKIYNPLLENDLVGLIKNNMSISCCDKIIKRDFIINNNILLEEGPNSEDLLWSTKCFCNIKSIAIFPKKYYIYEMTENSASRTLKYRNFESIIRNVGKTLFIIENSSFNKKTKKQIKSKLSESVYYVIGIISRYEKPIEQYIELIKENRQLLIRPSTIKYQILYVLLKLFGIKNAMKLFDKIIK